MAATSAKMANKGQITIPKAMRDKSGYVAGAEFHIVEVGQGFFLSPSANNDAPRVIDVALDQMGARLKSQGVSLETILIELRKIRESQE